jgi:hypothetical protein
MELLWSVLSVTWLLLLHVVYDSAFMCLDIFLRQTVYLFMKVNLGMSCVQFMVNSQGMCFLEKSVHWCSLELNCRSLHPNTFNHVLCCIVGSIEGCFSEFYIKPFFFKEGLLSARDDIHTTSLQITWIHVTCCILFMDHTFFSSSSNGKWI